MAKGRYYKLVSGSNIETKGGMVALLNTIGKADIVTFYLNETTKLSRRIISRLHTSIVSLLSGHCLKYYNGSAVFLREDVMRWHPNNDRNGFLAIFMVILLNEGKSCIEIPVSLNEHKDNASKAISMRNFLSVSQCLMNILLNRIQKTVK